MFTLARGVTAKFTPDVALPALTTTGSPGEVVPLWKIVLNGGPIWMAPMLPIGGVRSPE